MHFEVIRFTQPLFLYLLPIPFYFFVRLLLLLLRRQGYIRTYRKERVLPLKERHSRFGRLAFWFMSNGVITALIFALALPEIRVSLEEKTSFDVYFLLDNSASSQVEDVGMSRWERSLQFVGEFIKVFRWEGDRVGIVTFAHLAWVHQWPTTDPSPVLFHLDNLKESSPNPLYLDQTWDTNLAEALFRGISVFEKDKQLDSLMGKSRENAAVFVVVSDGDTVMAYDDSTSAMIKTLREKRIPIYTIGVGTTAGGWIPESAEYSALDRESLVRIAAEGDGRYFELDRVPDRDIALEILRDVEERSLVRRLEPQFRGVYWWFLLAAALFIVIGIVFYR